MVVTAPTNAEDSFGTAAWTRFMDAFRPSVLHLLERDGIDASGVTCQLHADLGTVSVHLGGCRPSPATRRAIAVRVLDAVGALGRTVGDVTVLYDTPAAPR